MTGRGLWALSAVATAEAARSGAYTVAEILESHLARKAEVDPALNAVVVDRSDAARREAAALDALRASGAPLGPLHGVPVTVKINVDVAGEANSNGLAAFKDAIAREDSPVVANLRRAGAVVLGMTNTPEYSFRFFTSNPLHGATLNPWDKDVTCGGSSGGAAVAVAAGVGAIAHGNDIAGSLRWPASCLGLFTIKPTQGRIPAFNPSAAAERPFASALMSVQGPLARSVADVRLALEAMAARDVRDPWWTPAPLASASAGAAPVRVTRAVLPADMDVDDAVLKLLDEAEARLVDAGHEVVARPPPDLDGAFRLWCDLFCTDVSVLMRDQIRRTASPAFQTYVDELLTLGRVLSGEDYLQALSERTARIRSWMIFLEETPLILAPISTRAAPEPDADLAGPGAGPAFFRRAMRVTTAVNVLGLPSAAAPIGFAGAGPAGVQLIGSRFREDVCLAAAAALESRGACFPEALWDRLGG